MVVASNDLAHWLATASNTTSMTGSSNFLTLYHTPFLKRDRYALQQIATLHTSITAHLQTIERSVSIVADSWKTSLRPLDQKLKPLTNLLRNYGVEVNEPKDGSSNTTTTLSNVMKEYIMMGHVNHSTSIANAMDQFFTGIQMNDQLVQRMERSLLSSMANVEATAIRCLLRPTQALGWQIQELSGLVQFFSNIEQTDDGIQTTDSADLENKSHLVQDLMDATEQLWISVENVMTSIVAGRMLVRDFCGWLRHAGSQVKARGTAPNSVQRENAKKRRITQDVLERLVAVLNKSGREKVSEGIGLSETVLDLKVTVRASKNLFDIFIYQWITGSSYSLLQLQEMLKPNTKSDKSSRPESPSSVRGMLYPKPNVAPSLERTINATKALFSNPLSNIPDQIKSTGNTTLHKMPKKKKNGSNNLALTCFLVF